MLEELIETHCEILIIDKDSEVIENYKEKVAAAYVADAINEEIIRKLVPDTIDAAIVDLGGKIEVSILVTNYLKKMGIKTIIAKAESDEHGEILKLVGATRVVFPNGEAAKRIAPLLLSSYIFSYMPISNDLVIAEVKVPDIFVGKTLLELNLRKDYQLNVVAFRKGGGEEYAYFSPEYRLDSDDVFLVVGREEDLIKITESKAPANVKGLSRIFKRFFK